jgi:hypothetical protein
MLPACLVEEVKALTDEGRKVELVEAEGIACAIFLGYPLPRGYNKPASDLLLMLPLSYRNGKPDMFWVEPGVVLANGAVPRSAEQVESHLNRQWRRFSWHMASWNPAVDDLRTYLEFVNSRLAKGV